MNDLKETTNKLRKTVAITVLIAVLAAFVIVLTKVIIPSRKSDTDHINPLVQQSEKAVAPDVQVGRYVTFGSYEQDNDLSNGKEEIEWLVLVREENKALLISKYSLDNQPYSEHITEVPWENCFLRKWLNDDFFNEAFSSEEQNSIITSVVTADENPFHKLSQGNDTMDKVFILSVIEANKYFSSSNERKCQGTEFCHAHGAPKSKDTGNCWWWLRSLNSPHIAAVVDDEGPIEAAATFNDENNTQSGGDYVTCAEASVRPSVWIDLEINDQIIRPHS